MIHWLLHLTGSDNPQGAIYGFWSGFGSDLMEFAILGTIFHKFNCHAKGCWRIGLHHVEGTPYVVCRKHHPVVDGQKPTHHQIYLAHRKANK